MPDEKRTRRQVVIQSLNRKLSSDTLCPWQLDLTQGMLNRLLEHCGSKEALEALLGNYLVREKYQRKQYDGPDSYTDLYGVRWSFNPLNGDIGHVLSYPLTEARLDLFDFPQPDPSLIKERCENLAGHKEQFKIFELSFAMFERAWTLRGMENLLIDFYENESFVHDLLDKICDFNLQVIDMASAYDIDCIMFGDDWGKQKGLIMGPHMWKQYIKPRIERMFNRVREKNLFICLHSCGDISELLEDLVSMGLNIYNTFQPEIYDLRYCQEKFGNDLTFYGGISTQGVFTRGKPEEVYKDVREKRGILNQNGGYITAPTHQLTLDVPLENILAFLEAVR